jgi:hypothetical protein
MIRQLGASNYRAFDDVEIALRPINFIFGPNNSGKSALLSVLSLLSQTLRSNDPTVPLLLNGPLEELGTFDDVVYRNLVDNDIKLRVDFEVSRRLRSVMSEPSRSATPKRANGYRWDGTFSYRKTRKQIIQSQSAISRIVDDDDEVTPIFETATAQNSSIQRLQRILIGSDYYLGGSHKGRISTEHFLPTPGSMYRILDSRAARIPEERREAMYTILDEIFEANYTLQDLLSNIEFVGPWRNRAERTYLFSGEHPGSVGYSGEKSIDVLVADELSRRKQADKLSSRLSAWLTSSGLANNLIVQPLTGRHYEIHVTHSISGESENIADVGFGISQVLPIAIAALSAKPDSVLVMQQPELHLHPAAQFALGDLFAQTKNNNVQTIIETHSEHMLLRILLLVAQKRISAEDVAVYYVHPVKDRKAIVSIGINDQGKFTSPWPNGFFDERLDEARRLASARLSHNRN